MLTKVFTTHPRNAIPQCCLTVDYNSDSCPLNEPTGSNAGSFASSTERSSSVRNGSSLTTKSLHQVRSISPGKAVCVWGGGVGGCLRAFPNNQDCSLISSYYTYVYRNLKLYIILWIAHIKNCPHFRGCSMFFY